MDKLPDHLVIWMGYKYLNPLYLNVLRLVCRRYAKLFPPHIVDAVASSVQNLHMNLIRWLMTIGCPVTMRAFLEVSKIGQPALMELLSTDIIFENAKRDPAFIQEAAIHGHEELVFWMLNKRWTIEQSELCDYAARSGNLEFLRKLDERGLPFSIHVICMASMSGNIHMVRWLREEKGMAIQDCTLQYAAISGDLDVLSYVWEQTTDEQRPSYACEKAARNSRLPALLFLLDHGCEWNPSLHDCSR